MGLLVCPLFFTGIIPTFRRKIRSSVWSNQVAPAIDPILGPNPSIPSNQPKEYLLRDELRRSLQRTTQGNVAISTSSDIEIWDPSAGRDPFLRAWVSRKLLAAGLVLLYNDWFG